MPFFGEKSRRHLSKLHPQLRDVLEEAIELVDFTIITSYRNSAEQGRLYLLQRTKVKYPHSKHNRVPAEAVDLAPWHPDKPHIRWANIEEFGHLAGIIKGIAAAKGVRIRWGGDWDSDGYTDDERFRDLGHLELELAKEAA